MQTSLFGEQKRSNLNVSRPYEGAIGTANTWRRVRARGSFMYPRTRGAGPRGRKHMCQGGIVMGSCPTLCPPRAHRAVWVTEGVFLLPRPAQLAEWEPALESHPLVTGKMLNVWEALYFTTPNLIKTDSGQYQLFKASNQSGSMSPSLCVLN